MCNLRGLLMLKLNRGNQANACFMEALDVKCYDAFEQLVGGEMTPEEGVLPPFSFHQERLDKPSSRERVFIGVLVFSEARRVNEAHKLTIFGGLFLYPSDCTNSHFPSLSRPLGPPSDPPLSRPPLSPSDPPLGPSRGSTTACALSARLPPALSLAHAVWALRTSSLPRAPSHRHLRHLGAPATSSPLPHDLAASDTPSPPLPLPRSLGLSDSPRTPFSLARVLSPPQTPS